MLSSMMKIREALTDAGVVDGIMMWISVAILLIVCLPVLYNVITASPTIVTSQNDIGNLSGGRGVLGSAALNTTQSTMISLVGSSFGLLIVVLIVIAAVVILGVVAYLRGGRK